MKDIRRIVFLITAITYIFYVTNCFVQLVLPSNSPYILIGVLLVCFCCYPMSLIKDKTFIFSLLYVFVLLLVSFIHPVSGFGYGGGGLDTVFIEVAFFLPSVCLSSILFREMDAKSVRVVAISTVVSLFLSFCYVIPIVFMDNSIAREISTADMHFDENILPGFWSYNMMHVVVTFLPVFFALTIYNKGFRRFMYAIMTLFVIVFVVQASITTTFIFLIFSLFILVNIYFYKRKYYSFFFVFECVLLVAVFLFMPTIVDFLLYYYDGTDMYDKIFEYQNFILGRGNESSSMSARTDFQQQAIDAFLNYPILGSTYEGGGHSILLNRLASLGIVGFVPLAIVLITVVRRTYGRLSKTRGYYFVALSGVFILLAFKNTFGCEGWLAFFVLIPSMFLMVENPNKNVK